MTTVFVVLEEPTRADRPQRIVGVFTDRALAMRVVHRKPGRYALTGPADREWSQVR